MSRSKKLPKVLSEEEQERFLAQFNTQRILDQVGRYGLLIGSSDEVSGQAARPAQQGAEGPGRPNGPEEQDERRLARVPTDMVHGGRWE